MLGETDHGRVARVLRGTAHRAARTGAPARRRGAPALRALRILLWCAAALTAPMLLAGLYVAGPSLRPILGLAAFAAPGAIAGWVAARFTRPRAAHRRALVLALVW